MSQLWLSVGTPHPEGGTELPGGQGWALGYSTALSMIWKCVKSSVLTLRCWDKQMEKPDLCCSGLGPCAQELMQPHSQGEIMGHRDTSGCSVLGRGGCGTPARLAELGHLYLLTGEGEHCQGSRKSQPWVCPAPGTGGTRMLRDWGKAGNLIIETQPCSESPSEHTPFTVTQTSSYLHRTTELQNGLDWKRA